MIFSNPIPAYVYSVTHLPTGKFYYGSRYRHIEKNLHPKQDFWKTYFTSSKEIQSLREETGNESFEYKIIYTNTDAQVCFEHEQKLIKQHIDNPLCVNKRYFDSVKGTRVYCTYGKTLSTRGQLKSETTKQRMSKPKSAEHCANISKAQRLNGGNGPASHTEESKNKTRETMKLKPPRPNKTCPHCNKIGGAIAMARWHFNNCKEKNVTSTI